MSVCPYQALSFLTISLSLSLSMVCISIYVCKCLDEGEKAIEYLLTCNLFP